MRAAALFAALVLTAMSMSASMPAQAQTKVRIGKPQPALSSLFRSTSGSRSASSRGTDSTLNPPTSAAAARAAGAHRRRARSCHRVGAEWP